MVLQPRQPVRRRPVRASYKSKVPVKFVRQEVADLTEIILDEAVWSRGLPDDIWCTILACLPLSSFFRLQCVCKKWSVIAQDPIFINAFTRASSQEACLFLAGGDGMNWIYEHGLNSWKSISSSFFCPKGSEGTCSPVAAVGSRLLFGSDQDYPLKVYNPLSGTQEALPAMLHVDENHLGRYGYLDTICEIRVIGMPVNPEENNYRILVMHKQISMSDDPEDYYEDDEFELEHAEYVTMHVHVYDSRTSEWDLKEIIDHGCGLNMLSSTLFGDGLQYLTVLDGHLMRESRIGDLMMACVSATPDDLGGYEWDSHSQPRLQLPKRDKKLRFVAAQIFVTRGRLMLAAIVPLQTTGNRFRKLKSIVIWELLEVGEKWLRITEIDLRELDPCLSRVSIDSFFLLPDGDTLYFGSNTANFVGIINVPTKTWRLLPPFPGFVPRRGGPDDTTEVRFSTFVYQPGFDSVT